MRITLHYICEDRDRHGNLRLYVRRNGRKIRIRERWGTPGFLDAYNSALDATERPNPSPKTPLKPAKTGSLRWLIERYYSSAEFKQLDVRTQRVRRGVLDGLSELHGTKPYARMEPRHVRGLRDDKAEFPEAANARVKAIRQVFKWAVEIGHAEHNPAKEVPYLHSGSQGFHSWSIEEVGQYEERHPIGTRARLALALLLYTGQRRSDVVLFGRQHVKDGRLVFTQEKNKRRRPVRLEIPILPELQRIIDASPTGDLTFLVTAFGRPFTTNGFGNKMRDWCTQAGIPHCSSHGLRKAMASRLAELGASEHEIMAVTGHRTSKEVSRYTRAARQKVLADSAMQKLATGQTENNSVPLKSAVAASGTKRSEN
jgi:integrase